MLIPKLYSITANAGRKMAAKGISMKNIEPIPHKKFEKILEYSTISEQGDKQTSAKLVKTYAQSEEIKKQSTHMKIRDGGVIQKEVMAMVIQISDICQVVLTINR